MDAPELIVITEQDRYRLQKLLEATRLDEKDAKSKQALREKLDETEPVFSEDIPPTIVTLNSRFTLRNLKTEVEQEYKLVLPTKADAKKRRVSILTPLGVVLLGLPEGATFELADGPTLKVTKVHYQPEAVTA